MRIGLSYDLKETVSSGQDDSSDALEEYDSIETVEAIALNIETQGHSTVKLGGGHEFLHSITTQDVDLVFNIAEGRGNYRSREAQVPSVLEMLDIPYSGSDPQCLSICHDKPLAKSIVASSGICTPRWVLINSKEELRRITGDTIPLPAFIKPAHEGSSKGIRLNCMVENMESLFNIAMELLDGYKQPVMVEKYIEGDEITVGMVGNNPARVLGIMRILPKNRNAHFIYSIEVKRQWEELVEYECPAQLEADITQRIVDSSLRIFQVLGCRDFARMDFRIGKDRLPYFLEINPLPGLNPKSSDLPIMSGKLGISYQNLISDILQSAIGRYA